MDKNNLLEVDISQLEIGEDKIKVCENDSATSEVECVAEATRRSTRRKQPPANDKRRVQSKPKKLPDDLNSKILINYYLNKRVKRHQTHLETIFEDPISTDIIMSRRKFSRSMQFPIEISLVKNKNKVRKRSMKAKERGSMKPKKLSMELLLEKLANIDTEDNC
ncbi:uncharacterized protein LOC130900870 [Diorhabda carinulata]|uniref:uncharacterized protein LOC130900870 n=1 Tax=Diorhabda carinulata TaxID=1163345 RepID=UPI0025A308BB|nr:uncharacterized protein LOC130900870 [Diorhabda carinulata]